MSHSPVGSPQAAGRLPLYRPVSPPRHSVALKNWRLHGKIMECIKKNLECGNEGLHEHACRPPAAPQRIAAPIDRFLVICNHELWNEKALYAEDSGLGPDPDPSS